MNYSFEYIDIILLAMIAGFIFLRLRGILGRKSGFEDEIQSSYEEKFSQETVKNTTTEQEGNSSVWWGVAPPTVTDSSTQLVDSGLIDPTVGISNLEYETKLNEEKRSIEILDPRFLQQFLNDMRHIMYYEKNSQYVNNRLIKTENTRIIGP